MKQVDKNLYCFWFGREMSDVRKSSLASLKQTELDIILITDKNLNDYIVEPLHPGYKYLIPQHKADYLRCYFMHFYGGAYADIKATTGSWLQSLQDLENSDSWFMGFYHPHAVFDCGSYDHLLESHYKDRMADQGFILKPNTPLTKDWYNLLIVEMDKNYKELAKKEGYALRYHQILLEILNPLWAIYSDKLIRTLPPLICENYI